MGVGRCRASMLDVGFGDGSESLHPSLSASSRAVGAIERCSLGHEHEASIAEAARPAVEGLEARVVLSLTPVAAGSPAPFSAIVKLDITYPDGEDFVGTGAMIDSYHVLTAGHVVYSNTHGGWATSITAIPELHGASEPFGRGPIHVLADLFHLDHL